jgi:PPOX class probable F420-dependent enzyme
MLSPTIRSLVAAGPLAHVVTLAADGSPHVSLAWVGVDGGELVIGTLFDQPKLRNLRRDPRIALSLVTGGRSPIGLDNYLVLHGHARITEGGAAELLAELARTYLGPDVAFPPMPNPPPGFVIRITVDRVAGIGPGAPAR